MEVDLKWIIIEEERTRHDALFYSQKPKNGYLSGEQARSLFIRSRLPLSELSKIWKLADISRDNLLDISEFATAMHLIQLRLKGFDIPAKLPTSLMPIRMPVTVVPPMTMEERKAYQRTFTWKENNNSGFIDTETACGIMVLSNLDSKTLSRIWNLADIDRDTKLSSDEFAIVLHLLRFCRKGYELEGSIDVMTMIPEEATTGTDNGEAKRQRLTELQTEKRKLLSLKEKFCLEISGGLNEDVINEKLRPELNKVEEKLYNSEKEETELRKVLQNLREKTKKESFKPFDRSFLLKKRLSGEDLFKGLQKKSSAFENEDSLLFESILTANDQLHDNTVAELSELGTKLESTGEAKESYKEQEVIDFTDSAYSSRKAGTISSNSTFVNGLDQTKSTVGEKGSGNRHTTAEISTTKRVINTTNISFPSTEKATEHNTRETTRSGNQDRVGANDESVSWVPTKTKQTILKTVEEKVLSRPGEGTKEETEEIADDTFSWAPSGKREVIVQIVEEKVLVKPNKDEKSKESFAEQTVSEGRKEPHVSHIHIDERLKTEDKAPDASNTNMSNGQYNGKVNGERSSYQENIVHEKVVVGVASNAESAANENIDKMFRQMSQDLDYGHVNGPSGTSKSTVDRGPSPTPQTSRESHKLPVGRVLSDEEEKALIDAGVLKKGEKTAHHYQPTQEDLIPMYLEEKRRKEEERRSVREIENEKRLKAREYLRLQDEDMKRQYQERKHAIKEAKGKLEMQMSVNEYDDIPVRRASVSRADAGRLIEMEVEQQKQREEETRRKAEEMKAMEAKELEQEKIRAFQNIKGKQIYVDGESSVEHQPPVAVVRRQKKDPTPLSYRKSWVEVEIERQKQKDDELKQEIESRKEELQSLDSEPKQRQQILKRQIEISEEPVVVLRQAVESQPVVNVRQAANTYSKPGAINKTTANTKSDDERLEENIKGAVHSNMKHYSVADSIKENSNLGAGGVIGKRDVVDAKVTLTPNAEAERKIREEEERRRILEMEIVRQESLKREADELMREKRIREEELKMRRDTAARDAEKRRKEEDERKALSKQDAESRRLSFYVQKVKLEERVIKALSEKSSQPEVIRRSRSSSTSSEEPAVFSAEVADSRTAMENSEEVVKSETRKSVRDTLACFEQPLVNKEQNRDVVRRKRFSLNLDDAVKQYNVGDAKKLGKTDRSSFYGDGLMAREVQMQIEREEELQKALQRNGDAKVNLGDVSQSRTQFGDQSKHKVIMVPKGKPPSREMLQRQNHSSSPVGLEGDQSPSLGTMSEERIINELEELRQKEREIQARRNMLEKMAPPSAPRKELYDIKKNPLPSKIQMRKAPASVMAATSKPVPKPASQGASVRKSFIELEKEKERIREEELLREREAIQQEIQLKEGQKKQERASEQNVREVQEAKNSNPRRISGMASMWEQKSQRQ